MGNQHEFHRGGGNDSTKVVAGDRDEGILLLDCSKDEEINVRGDFMGFGNML